MNLFFYNIKNAFRNLRKKNIYTILNITGLTVGLGVFLLSLMFVYNEYQVDKSFANYDRIYRLVNEKKDCGLDYDLMEIISENYPQVEANCVLSRFEWPLLLKANNEYFKVETGISTTNQLFDVFDLRIIKKSAEKPFAEKASIILTQSLAKRIFGEKDPLGQTINFNNFFDLKVTAIVEDFPRNTSLEADYLINAEDEKKRMGTVCETQDDCYNPMSHYLLLKQDVNRNQFELSFNESINKFQKRVEHFSFQALTDIYLSEPIEKSGNKVGNVSFIKIISIIGLVVLILSIINYLNFSISLQQTKIKEVSIKKVNGANSLQLFFYHLSESFIVILFTTVLSIFVIFIFKDSFAGIFGNELNFQVLKEPVFLVYFIVILLVVLLISSLTPTYSLIKTSVIEGLNYGKVKRKSKVKILFTTIQFVASITLLITVFFINKQMSFVENWDLGFEQENLLKIQLPFRFKKSEVLKQKMSDLSFVESATLSKGNPGNIQLRIGSGEEDDAFSLSTLYVDSTFLQTFKIKLVEGRTFLSGDNKKACLFNETAMKMMEWDNVKNKRFNNLGANGYEVIGVVEDFLVSSMHKKQQPVCLAYNKNGNFNILSVRIMPGNIKQQIQELKTVWASITDNPFEFEFYDTFIEAQYQKERQLSKSISLLALIAIFLTLIGVLGQVIQNSIARTKEIGIRRVNGASVMEIINMLNLEYLKWVIIAFLLAVPIAYFSLDKWLENFAYRTSLSWWVFALAGIIILLITLLTISWQTIRVARRNPVKSLRYE